MNIFSSSLHWNGSFQIKLDKKNEIHWLNLFIRYDFQWFFSSYLSTKKNKSENNEDEKLEDNKQKWGTIEVFNCFIPIFCVFH